MKVPLLLGLSYISAAVLAGGLQGSYERVTLYFAYEIDGLNGPAAQTLGFRCKKGKWNGTKKKCENPPPKDPNDPVDTSDPWEPCRGRVRADRRCTFDELMIFVGGAPDLRPRFSEGAVDSTHRIIDIDRAALNTYKVLTEVKPGQNPKNPSTVGNFPAYKAMKGDVWEFNDYIQKLGRVIHNTWVNVGIADARLEYKWVDVSRGLDGVKRARTGDHGKFLIPEARTNTHLSGLTIRTQDLGPIPNEPGRNWETVDCVATVQNRDPQISLADAEQKIQNFQQTWYPNNKNARDHRAVIQSWDQVGANLAACTRGP